MQSPSHQFLEFLFRPATDTWLAVLRVGLGLQVTLYSLSLRNDWIYLFSGTVRRVTEGLLSLEAHFIPRLGWLLAAGAHVGLHEEMVLFGAWACLLFAGCALALGV